jgi:hypothetical protein
MVCVIFFNNFSRALEVYTTSCVEVTGFRSFNRLKSGSPVNQCTHYTWKSILTSHHDVPPERQPLQSPDTHIPASKADLYACLRGHMQQPIHHALSFQPVCLFLPYRLVPIQAISPVAAENQNIHSPCPKFS